MLSQISIQYVKVYQIDPSHDGNPTNMADEDVETVAGTNRIPLHPEAVRHLRLLKQLRGKPYYELGVEKARLASTATSRKLAGTYEFNGSITDLRIPCPNVTGTVPSILIS